MPPLPPGNQGSTGDQVAYPLDLMNEAALTIFQQLAATIRLLKEDNEQGRLDAAITCLEEQAQHFTYDPAYDWAMEAQKVLSPQLMQEVIDRYAQVSRALAYFL